MHSMEPDPLDVSFPTVSEGAATDGNLTLKLSFTGDNLDNSRPLDYGCGPLFERPACWPCDRGEFEEPTPDLWDDE